MRHRTLSAALLCAVLASAGCGTRMSNGDLALAERGGLRNTAALSPVADQGASGVGTDTGATSGALGSVADVGASSGTAAASGSASSGAGAGATSTPRPGASGSPTAAAQTATPAAPGRAGPAAAPAAPGTTPAPTQPGAVAQPTGGTPVAVASVATLSGPVGAFVKDSIFAVSVWAKWINAKGGVGGHPVRHIVSDDGGDPARYNANVRQLVEEQGVIAFIFNTIGFAGGDLSYVNQKRIPIIGHEAGTEDAYASPMVFTPFPSGTTYAYSLIAGGAEIAIPAGKTKLASLACSDVKLCDLFDKTWNGPAAKELGFEVVYRARPSLTQPDFTAECISARQAGATAIIGALDNNSYLRLARSCARQSYKPLIIVADQLSLPSLAADPVMEGSAIGTKVAPWPGTQLPGLVEAHDAFRTTAPGVEFNGAHAAAWVSAKVFEAAARNLPAQPTSADVLNGLWAINGDTTGGMTYPLHFPKDQPSPRKFCWGVAQISGGKFVAPGGGALKCK